MSKVCTVVVNGEAFSANCGDLLLDAALMNGIDIPHDCRSGICGTCRVRVLDGLILAGHTSDPEAVYAYGVDYATQQCADLLKNKVDGLHYYTLNKSKATVQVVKGLNVQHAV